MSHFPTLIRPYKMTPRPKMGIHLKSQSSVLLLGLFLSCPSLWRPRMGLSVSKSIRIRAEKAIELSRKTVGALKMDGREVQMVAISA